VVCGFNMTHDFLIIMVLYPDTRLSKLTVRKPADPSQAPFFSGDNAQPFKYNDLTRFFYRLAPSLLAYLNSRFCFLKIYKTGWWAKSASFWRFRKPTSVSVQLSWLFPVTFTNSVSWGKLLVTLFAGPNLDKWYFAETLQPFIDFHHRNAIAQTAAPYLANNAPYPSRYRDKSQAYRDNWQAGSFAG